MTEPVLIVDGFLAPAAADAFLADVVRQESCFEPTRLGNHNRVDTEMRRSRALACPLGWRARLRGAVAPLVPAAVERLGLSPIQVDEYEMEVVAHEDGAFYGPHVDLHQREAGSPQGDRVLSMVAYFHHEPKRFSGGTLRLFPLPAGRITEKVIEVEPRHNRAVVFSSWVPHEVTAVHCPSGRFVDARFALNCWVLQRRK